MQISSAKRAIVLFITKAWARTLFEQDMFALFIKSFNLHHYLQTQYPKSREIYVKEPNKWRHARSVHEKDTWESSKGKHTNPIMFHLNTNIPWIWITLSLLKDFFYHLICHLIPLSYIWPTSTSAYRKATYLH